MKKYLLLFAIAIPTMFSSCLKDKKLTDKVYGSAGIGEIKVVELTEASLNPAVMNVYTTPTAVDMFTINAGTPVTEDLTVTLVKDDALVTTAGYSVLPTSFYTIGSLSVTIPKGTAKVKFPVTILNSSTLLGTNYALGFKIGSVSNSSYGISANYNSVVSPFVIKNKFDGIYNLRCRMVAPSNDRPTVNVSTAWTWGGHVNLETFNASTVDLFDDWGFGDYIQPIQTSTLTFSGFGQTAPRFVLNETTNKVTSVVNNIAAPTNGRQFAIDPSKDSYWDPATGNMYVHFIMTQPTFQPLLIADTFYFVSPR